MRVILQRVVVSSMLTLLALFLIALAINLRDESLTAEARNLLLVPANVIPPQQNLYVALAGFHAPSGQSVVTAGEARIAYYNEHLDDALRSPHNATGPATLNPISPAALSFQGKLDFGNPRATAFWTAARDNRPVVDQLLEQNRELYTRYLALHDATGYVETERASVMVGLFTVPNDLRGLFLAKFALDMQTGYAGLRQVALADLRDDINLWRRMLTGEGTLISKMLALAYLQVDYLILSDLIADSNVPVPDNIDTFLPEPEPGEWNIGRVFQAEFRITDAFLRQFQMHLDGGGDSAEGNPPASGPWLDRVLLGPLGHRFFKLNATENLHARLMNRYAAFAALDPGTFAAQRAAYRAWVADNADHPTLRWVYNPVGRAMVTEGLSAYEQYPLRPYDVAALQRLVRLSIELRRHHVAPSAVLAFMERHPEWSSHPADGRPFAWHPATGEIVIQTIADQPPERRFAVTVWQPLVDPGAPVL